MDYIQRWGLTMVRQSGGLDPRLLCGHPGYHSSAPPLTHPPPSTGNAQLDLYSKRQRDQPKTLSRYTWRDSFTFTPWLWKVKKKNRGQVACVLVLHYQRSPFVGVRMERERGKSRKAKLLKMLLPNEASHKILRVCWTFSVRGLIKSIWEKCLVVNDGFSPLRPFPTSTW